MMLKANIPAAAAPCAKKNGLRASRGAQVVPRVAEMPREVENSKVDAFEELKRMAAKVQKQSVNRPQKVRSRTALHAMLVVCASACYIGPGFGAAAATK